MIIWRQFFLFLIQNIHCDPSLELSRQGGGSYEGAHVFTQKYGKLSLIPRAPDKRGY